MQSEGMAIFSIYKAPISNIIPLGEVDCKTVYLDITSSKYLEATDKLRSEKDRSKEIKSTQFDYVTFSGVFKKRDRSFLVQHSGLICVDIDHITNIESVKIQILSGLTPNLMFVSPSGDGLKVIYKIDLNLDHSEYFTALTWYFHQTFNIDIDPSGKDVARACFLPHDPECFYSDNPSTLDRSFIDTFIEQPQSQYPKKTERVTDINEIFSRLKVWIENTETFSKGTRNNYITKLAYALNRYGVTEPDCIRLLLDYEREDFTREQIIATIKSIYRNSKQFNTESFESSAPRKASKSKNKKTAEEPLPLLPIEGMPQFLQLLVTECAEVYGTHRDFWAGAILAATALGIGQSFHLKGIYENAAVLWLASVAPSGVGKTEPMDFAFKPFHTIDLDSIKTFESEQRKYEMTKAQHGKDSDEKLPDPPKCKQYILSDTTPEALIEVHKVNSRGIVILRDELHGWLLDIGRYNKSGEVQNWLSAWSMKAMTFNRKNSTPKKINSPFINICGGLQPEILVELAKDHRAYNGFMPRFCFVFPDQAIRPNYREMELSPNLKNQYADYIKTLLNISIETEVYLSLEAKKVFETYANQIRNEYNIECTAYVKALLAKLEIICLRFALILHVSKLACSGQPEPYLTAETMLAAIDITNYFKATGMKVYRQLENGMSGLNNKSVARYLRGLGASQNEISAALKVSQPYVSGLLKT